MSYKFGIKLFLAAFLLGLSAVAANAANVIVNIPNDLDGVGNCATGGSCSMRQAINTVGNNDSIFFDLPAANCPNGVCTVELTTGTLLIFRSMTFIGTGARSLIVKRSAAAGTPNFPVFTIAVNGIGTIGIYGMTISNGAGSTGGGIVASGGISLTLSGVNITNNNSGGYGGISCNCTSTLIENSLIANNSGVGGGIQNASGEMTIVNSTISGNTAVAQNGVAGIFNGGNSSNPATLNLINVTVSNNKTMIFGGGFAVGGVSNGGTAYARNTIIAGNRGETNAPNDIGGFFFSRGNNLIGDTTGGSGFGGSGLNDILNQPARLAPLADNGGASDTHALLPSSPAINAGNDCVLNLSCANVNPPMNLAFDQRTQPFARKFGAAIDIGAFELQQNVVIRKTPFDFDGDGKADIAVTRVINNNLAWYEQNSLTGFNAVNFGNIIDRLVPADYDGDGKTDIAVARNNSDNTITWYVLQSRDGFTAQTFGFALDKLVPADYDGDGKADIAVVRSANGALTWYINRSQLGFTAISFGATGDVPVVGDYDGDGKADVAVVRENSGGNLTWYLNRSQAGFTGFQFGSSGDKLVAADYDGDGKTDAAIYRPANGTWYTSQNAAINYGAVQFGANGDIPVPADYDGDGKTDVAVARANSGTLTWYLNRSQSGFTGIGFGNSTDRAVENAYIP